MSLLPLRLPPGVYRNGTPYQAQGRWFDANLVRWYENTMRPVGGWRKSVSTQMEGPGRGIVAWRAFNNARFAGIGTPSNLYVWDDDAITDITPDDFPAGLVDTFYGVGYGFGDYGAGPYGETGGSGAKTDATTWSLDNFGENLLAMASHDGKLYQWAPGDDKAALVAEAPEGRAILVTQERIVMVLGADGNPRKVSWSSQEDITTSGSWDASDTNQAGDLEIQSTGNLLCGIRVQGANLLLTTTDAHRATYLGLPYVYGIERAADACGIISGLAGQPVEGGAMWMGFRNFFQYSGGAVRVIPCDVQDYVFSDINISQCAKVCSGHVSQYAELWWFYPSANSTTLDRYVVYNYHEQHWSVGTLSRSCWIDAGVFLKPLAVSEAGFLYEHESGFLDDVTPRTTTIFAKSGPVELGSGDQVMVVTQLIPDEVTPSAFQARFATQFTPEGPNFDYGPYPLLPYTDVRLTGRQVAVSFEAVVDMDSRIGVMRFDAHAGGRR